MEKPKTASAIITFAENLENYSSEFYEKLAEKYVDLKETFLSFVKESKKNKTLVKRTYQETISDALEACFSFEGTNLKDYAVEKTLTEGTTYPEALKLAMRIEEKAENFYSDMAERSKSLLATIPRAFKKVAEKRTNRKLKLKILLNNLK